MESYIEKDGKKLRFGYTTGSCAAAAAKAAAWMLLTGQKKETISLTTPKGVTLTLAVEDISMGPDRVSCAIRKDSGDDPDVTNGALICAEVTRREAPGIAIDGGFGVGRVTKKGLDQSVGNAAINSVPRQMIRENLCSTGGHSITVFRRSAKLSNCIHRCSIVTGIFVLCPLNHLRSQIRAGDLKELVIMDKQRIVKKLQTGITQSLDISAADHDILLETI